MRIFGARIFSKSFGGKIQRFQTDGKDMEKLMKKKRRMRILSARIFLSLLAGKLENWTAVTLTTNESRKKFHKILLILNMR